MLYATRIKMNYGSRFSKNPEDIDQIYIYEHGWYRKSTLHDHLKEYPRSIVVNIPPYPYLIPAVSRKGEKYVRSNPDVWKHDDLMDLPRE